MAEAAIVGHEPGKPPDDERDDDEVHGEHGAEESEISEGAADFDQGDAEERGEKQDREHGVRRRGEHGGGAWCQDAEYSAADDRGNVEGDLVPVPPVHESMHPISLGNA